MQITTNYIRKIKNLKKKTELRYVGLVLYIFMVSLSRLRWLWAAKIIGKFIIRKYSKNYAVNSLLAVVFSQLWEPKSECDALMILVRSGKNDVELLARAGESAAYSDDLASLHEVRNAATPHGGPLLAYLDGLIAFFNMNANYLSLSEKRQNEGQSNRKSISEGISAAMDYIISDSAVTKEVIYTSII